MSIYLGGEKSSLLSLAEAEHQQKQTAKLQKVAE